MDASILNTILEVATNAPSSHNTQPWKVKISNTTLRVGYDPKRQLFVGDPNKRELFMSLGCFIESIVLSAEDEGWSTMVKYDENEPENLATISFVEAKEIGQHHWEGLILDRRSDRNFYSTDKVSNENAMQLLGQRTDDCELYLYESDEEKDFFAKMTFESTLEIMSDKSFRMELASWVRNNWTKKPDGMPAYAQGMPGVVSLFAKFFIENIPAVPKDQAKKDSSRVRKSSHIGLLCIDSENIPNLIECGRLYQRLCLVALSLGIKTSAISAAVINTKTNEKIVGRFNLKKKPVILMRFGYSTSKPKSLPRLSVSQITSATS
jgi:hypothetical protein